MHEDNVCRGLCALSSYTAHTPTCPRPHHTDQPAYRTQGRAFTPCVRRAGRPRGNLLCSVTQSTTHATTTTTHRVCPCPSKAFIIIFPSHPQVAPSCFTLSNVSPPAPTPCPPPPPSLLLRGPGPPSPTTRENRTSPPQRATCRWTQNKTRIKTHLLTPTNMCSLTRRCISSP